MSNLKDVGSMIIYSVILLLIIGALLGTETVSSITWVNMTLIQGYYSAFFVGYLGLLGLAGAAYGIAMAVRAFKGILSGKSSDITA